MKRFAAVVVDIKLESRAGLVAVWWMSLNQTKFELGDTGRLQAMTRSGTQLQISVDSVVQDSDGVLWHVVEKPLAAGTDVIGEVLDRSGSPEAVEPQGRD